MTEYVRVRDLSTGHHYTTTRLAAQGVDGLEILDGRDAVDSSGRVLGPQFSVTIEEAAKAKSTSKGA